MSNKLDLAQRDAKLNPRQIRSSGFIPITVYGKELKESLSLQISATDYKRLNLSHSVKIIDGEVQDQKSKFSLLVKSIEKHPISLQVLNIQFQAVSPESIVFVTVPIIFEGVSPLVQSGGTLSLTKKTVNLACIARSIPSSVKFDLTRLQGQNHLATYADIELTEGVSLRSDAKQIIAKISVPQIAATDKAATK